APGNPYGHRIFAYGFRNSFGFDFDPRTGRLWLTENGPECNDELDLVVKGRNYGWGPSADCSTGSPPGNTNRDGPNPAPPERVYNPVIAPAGAVFCRRCGLGEKSLGALFLGAYNTGAIRRVRLTKDRLGVATQSIVYTHGRGILSMEASPNGELFF